MKRVLLVGDKPSPKMKPGAKPFKGAACQERLQLWIEQLRLNSERAMFVVINQCDYAWADFYYWDLIGIKIVALGNNASKALKGIKHFKLPHPSGLNRQINNKRLINRKLKECGKWLSN